MMFRTCLRFVNVNARLIAFNIAAWSFLALIAIDIWTAVTCLDLLRRTIRGMVVEVPPLAEFVVESWFTQSGQILHATVLIGGFAVIIITVTDGVFRQFFPPK
jgi:hypothetical protein